MVVTSMEAVENGSFGGEVLYGTLQNGTLSAGRLSDLVPADVQKKYLGYIDEMIKRAFLLDAEHRQEDHRLRFQVIQVATDGADSAGQSKGNIHRVQAAVRASRFTLCSKQRQQETVQRRAVLVFGKKAVADSRACPGCGSDSLL